jgi:hypothetical protein
MTIAQQTVFHDRRRPSALVLPIIPQPVVATEAGSGQGAESR